MPKLQRFKSFKALKSSEKTEIAVKRQRKNFSEFESFIQQLRMEYSHQKNDISAHGK